MRKVSGLLLVIMMALLLAACGDDDGDDAEPTEAATQPAMSTDVTEEEEPTVVATVPVSTPESVISGTASPVASPVVVASPVIASPVAVASPVASPVAATPLTGITAPDAPEDGATTLVSLTGTVTLPGAENETYVVTNDGCMGIGAFAGMQPGRQVVVRDEAGSIIGVATLAVAPEADGCAWRFALDVPASAFYAVSIPMVVEHVFTREEVAKNDGTITIPLT